MWLIFAVLAAQTCDEMMELAHRRQRIWLANLMLIVLALLMIEMVGLGHRRLSIIDISTGSQPIANEDDSAAVILNGEIYNFQSLRQELLEKGHTFQSNSDTEVIVISMRRRERSVCSASGGCSPLPSEMLTAKA